MDQMRFDNLTRSIADPKTRRGFLGGLAALGAGLLAGRTADAQPITQAYCGNQVCERSPGGCRAGCVCCLYRNAKGKVINSRCQPPGTCGPGEQVGGTTTTTTAAPTTSTTTSTTTTTTTTTTTPNPLQGTCPTGARRCASPSYSATCATSGLDCGCFASLGGATICGDAANALCVECGSDSDCDGQTGVGSICVTTAGGPCTCTVGTACIRPCVDEG